MPALLLRAGGWLAENYGVPVLTWALRRCELAVERHHHRRMEAEAKKKGTPPAG